MPWKESSVKEERRCFVARLLDGEAMTDMCREFGIWRRAAPRARGTPLSEGAAPNDLWCADFKLGNGCCCSPLTVTDQASRVPLMCEALESTRENLACTAFERLFAERGQHSPSAPTTASPSPVPMRASG